MIVADIDLDIFLSEVSSFDHRPRAPSSVHPWSEAQVRHFLEEQCQLSRDRTSKRPKGYFIVHHDEAFPIFEALSRNGATPLTVAHIDAHSDFGTGFGDQSWIDIGQRVLGFDPERRVKAIPRSGPERISPANYLSFALACRWIASLTYVHHAQSGHDLMPFFFRSFDTECEMVELRHIPHGLFDAVTAGSKDKLIALPHVLEPPILFRKVAVEDYRALAPFDYVILCQSPGYTPTEADALIPIFEEYVDFEVRFHETIGKQT
ncbi:UPF0489 family protein [Mesorhizobium sp. M0018]|uniref:UPF0489 family protein n=1 Tax=Mesorhizobium sp. M0018 TaxID=2956844 RepID=UPI00333DF282